MELIRKDKCKYNPCVVDYSKHLKLFFIGCYTLVEKELQDSSNQLRAQNNRLGSLLVCDGFGKQTNKEFELVLGGIFDLRIVKQNQFILEQRIEWIALAHASGYLGLYQFEADSMILQIISSFGPSSPDKSMILLTSLEVINLSTDQLLMFTGDSNGELRSYHLNISEEKNEKSINQLIQRNRFVLSSSTDYNHPIWYIKSLKLFFGQQCFILVFVGAEDSRWRLYDFNFQLDKFELSLMHLNKDAKAGVTSFEFLNRIESIDSDKFDLKLLVGSYDETIRLYNLNLFFDAKEKKIEPIECKLMKKIIIEGSGIWRIKAETELLFNKASFLVSAMYAGAYVLSLTVPHEHENKVKHSLTRIDIMNPNELVYDVACDFSSHTFLYVSFYDCHIYFLKK